MLDNLRKLVLENGKCTSMAQLAIRAAIIDKALTLGYDTHTQLLVMNIKNFGLHKLLSLDVPLQPFYQNGLYHRFGVHSEVGR